MSVVPVSKDPRVVQETNILIPTNTNNKNNVQGKTNSISSEYISFCKAVRYSLVLVAINIFVISCLFMIPLVQMIAWEDELRNLTNSTTVIQYQPILKSISGCQLITYFIILVLYACIVGINKIIELFREIPLKMWLFIVCVVIFILAISYFVNIPTTGLETFTKNFCKKIVFNTDINGNPSLALPQDGSLPPGISYSFYCMLCVTILCNIQHIIIILLIVKIKPTNFEFYKKDNSDKNSSKPSSQSSTAQTQMTSKEKPKPEIVP